MFNPTRRRVLVGCSAAIAAMTSGRLSYVAFGSAEQEPHQDILLVVFLRGGIDGLSVVPIIDGPDRAHYESNRLYTAVPTQGDNAAINLDERFGLHPAAAPLHELFQDEKLAIVHAAGLTSDTRSHFDAMKEMELGTPNQTRSTSGWLTRHLASGGNLSDDLLIPSLAVGNLVPDALAGNAKSIGMANARNFSFRGHWDYADWQRQALRGMYGGTSWLHEAGRHTLDAVDIVEHGVPEDYTPSRGVEYPNGSFGERLQTVAQMIKLQMGMRVATVDLGGWDTHEEQGGSGGGYFAYRLAELAQGLHAFYTDLSGPGRNRNVQRVTTVVMSEFGRSLKENGSRGTDHGHGNVMLVLGDQVNGGKVYGEWPGLAVEQLYDRRDLDITTDYRRVLSDILIRRLRNPNLGTIFPGYTTYAPLDIVKGDDLAPIY